MAINQQKSFVSKTRWRRSLKQFSWICPPPTQDASNHQDDMTFYPARDSETKKKHRTLYVSHDCISWVYRSKIYDFFDIPHWLLFFIISCWFFFPQVWLQDTWSIWDQKVPYLETPECVGVAVPVATRSTGWHQWGAPLLRPVWQLGTDPSRLGEHVIEV